MCCDPVMHVSVCVALCICDWIYERLKHQPLLHTHLSHSNI
jgi:hypothetical protein